jgi:hypothetical protein
LFCRQGPEVDAVLCAALPVQTVLYFIYLFLFFIFKSIFLLCGQGLEVDVVLCAALPVQSAQVFL